MNWERTKRVNKYGEYGQYVWIEYILICVYRRKYGWGFTCKARMTEGGVAQTSSDTNEYYASADLAKVAAIRYAGMLKEMFVPEEPDIINALLNNLAKVESILKTQSTKH